MNTRNRTSSVLNLAAVAATTAVLLLAQNCASAAITYVDATTTNTTIGGAAIVLGDPPAGGANVADDANLDNNDGFWTQRTFANNGTIFAAASNGNETISNDPLNTSHTLTTPGVYDIYGFFWASTQTNAFWDIDLALGTGAVVPYVAGTPPAVLANTLTFSNAPLVAEGNRDMYAVNLGTWNTAVDGLTFDVSAFQGTGVTFERTWYDGVGFELQQQQQPAPEPSTAILATLGLITLGMTTRSNSQTTLGNSQPETHRPAGFGWRGFFVPLVMSFLERIGIMSAQGWHHAPQTDAAPNEYE